MSNREEHYEVTIRYHDNGVVEAIFWKQNGVGHRLDGPATTWFDSQGRLVQESWVVNGKFHRPYQDGPAYTQIDPATGIVLTETYYWEGKMHRIGGPAVINRRRHTGEISTAYFVVNGVQYWPSRANRRRMLGRAPA